MTGDGAWRRSSFCGSHGSCVEFYQFGDGVIGLRNKTNSHGYQMLCSPEEWEAFIAGVKAGEFNLTPEA